MCKAWEDMRRETIEKTTEKVEEKILLQNIRNLMETLQLSAEQAMKALKIPEESHVLLAAKL